MLRSSRLRWRIVTQTYPQATIEQIEAGQVLFVAERLDLGFSDGALALPYASTPAERSR